MSVKKYMPCAWQFSHYWLNLIWILSVQVQVNWGLQHKPRCYYIIAGLGTDQKWGFWFIFRCILFSLSYPYYKGGDFPARLWKQFQLITIRITHTEARLGPGRWPRLRQISWQCYSRCALSWEGGEEPQSMKHMVICPTGFSVFLSINLNSNYIYS